LLDAANVYDRAASEAAATTLVGEARRSGALYEAKPLKNALTALRNNRWFDLLWTTGDGLMQAGDARSALRRLYAQGLIDSGAIFAAVPFLERLARDTKDADPDEYDEARGLLGRAWKQAYVGGDALTATRGKALIERAATWYYEPYKQKATLYWHAINTVACLARAERDGVATSGNFPNWEQLARDLRTTIKNLAKPEYWDYATAAEACVALRDWKGALEWLETYLRHPDTSAFAIAATLRQFVEVWQLSAAANDGSGPVVQVLEAAKLKKGAGESLDPNAALQGLAEKADLQAVLGDESYKTLEWYRRGLTRANAVGRIGMQASQGIGTGFLVQACEVDPNRQGQLFITNHHVVPDALPNWKNAVVIFESLDGSTKRYGVKNMLWTSPIAELDATVLELNDDVKGVEAYPLCGPLPDLATTKARVYVIGHPGGATMQFSLDDNLMIDYLAPKIHYRAPTDKGSSGSPVFDSDWALLALHHSGGKAVRRLHGDGTYAANEGLYFPAIAEAFRKATAQPPG
jgi:V8-like Glu-specific endopeptidase